MKRAAVVGTFDGVHLGHRYLLGALKTLAARRGLEPIALVLDPNPLALIDPARAPKKLTEPEERIAKIGELSVEARILNFSEELRRKTAREFLEYINIDLGVEMLLIGFNNHIGSDRVSAASEAIAALGRETGVQIIAAQEYTAQPVSSTLVRRALQEGNVERANELLGEEYTLTGEVVKGQQLGRTIGFPTANVAVGPDFEIPRPGVYWGYVGEHPCVINIGRRPTVDKSADAPLTVEVNILDFSGDLYGRRISVRFAGRLRDEKKFGSIEELKHAIQNDVDHVRQLIRH